MKENLAIIADAVPASVRPRFTTRPPGHFGRRSDYPEQYRKRDSAASRGRLRLLAHCERLLERPLAGDLRKRVVATVTRELDNRDANVALRAATILASRPASDTAKAMTRHLGQGSSEVRDLIETALADRHRADPVPFLDWMMGSDPERLEAGIRVVGRMANPMTVPLLRELARSTTVGVRLEASRALVAVQSRVARPSLSAPAF